uniref:RING-type domain-containing protein n=2 Tax=Oryza TaxID=4527 RepID=A0A0E0N499_ORYRU
MGVHTKSMSWYMGTPASPSPGSAGEAQHALSSGGGGGSDASFDTNMVCAICLGEFADGEKVRVLPRCGHGFHVRCVDTWLVSHDSCPTCRGSVLHGATTKHKPTAAAAAAGSRRPGSEVDAPAAAAVTVVIA